MLLGACAGKRHDVGTGTVEGMHAPLIFSLPTFPTFPCFANTRASQNILECLDVVSYLRRLSAPRMCFLTGRSALVFDDVIPGNSLG